MSTKSSQHPNDPKPFLNKKWTATAILICVVFVVIIVVYPRIFNPSNIGKNTSPAPQNPLPTLEQTK